MEQQSSAGAPQRKHGGRPFPPGVSGNPRGGGAVSARTEELFVTMVVDFDSLSATDEILLRAACRLLARAEKTKDVDAAVRLNSEARRGIDSLRRRHAPKHSTGSSLADLLRQDHMDQRVAADAGQASPDAIERTGGAPIEDATPPIDGRPKAKPMMALDSQQPEPRAHVDGIDAETLARLARGEAV